MMASHSLDFLARRVIAAQDSPVVPVSHSYGGAVQLPGGPTME
jgi:hypothetical protein